VTDEDLVRRCLAGDTRAMRTFVERFQGEIFAICVRLLNHRQDAEDIAQEVFVRLFHNLRRWDSNRPLRPWIHTITVNRCRTCLSRRLRIPSPVEHLEAIPARSESQLSDELVQGLRQAIDHLRLEYREVFVLFHEQGLSYDEIAEVIQRPVGTVKTWLHRARAIVLQRLRHDGLLNQDDATVAEECHHR
jgi:RNA polymerase sigma factor (sigma-70 family)